jgi:hypothetical protein
VCSAALWRAFCGSDHRCENAKTREGDARVAPVVSVVV